MSEGKLLKVLKEKASIGKNKLFKDYQQGSGRVAFFIQDGLEIVECDGNRIVIQGVEIVEEDADNDAQKQKVLKEYERKQKETQRMAEDKGLSSRDGRSGFGVAR